MTARIAVVTGANRGLGLETVKQLAERGLHVVLAARKLEKAERAAAPLRKRGLSVEPVELDVASDESVAAFGSWLAQSRGRADVLVNNAGEMFAKDPATGRLCDDMSAPASLVLQALNTNTLGAYRLCQLLLPAMKAAGYGRIVNVSSGMGGLTEMDDGYPAYRISKTALSAVTVLFHHEGAPVVKVNAVCPGWVRTDMGGPQATRDLPVGAAGIVWAATLPDDGPSGGFFRDGRRVPW
jgi:NAD(P)-dependent dehydrogenase (short-subunit alcohol dehydrogenase family)